MQIEMPGIRLARVTQLTGMYGLFFPAIIHIKRMQIVDGSPRGIVPAPASALGGSLEGFRNPASSWRAAVLTLRAGLQLGQRCALPTMKSLNACTRATDFSSSGYTK